MERTLAIHSSKKIGQKIRLAGWVDSYRNHGKLIFIDLRDRSGLVQVVFYNDKTAIDLRAEWVIEVEGLVKKRDKAYINPNLTTGKIEIEAVSVKVLSKSQELPFDLSKAELNVSLPVLLDNRPLSLRHPKIKAIFKVQEAIITGFRQSLKTSDFTEIQVPTIVPSATEGGAEVFKIDYFDKNAYLAQSPQFYKQIMVGVFERVFTLAHAYRAEPSVTTRHMTEYVGLDAEIGFVNSFEEIMTLVEKTVKDVFAFLAENCTDELKMFSATLPLIGKSIPRLKMREAQEIILTRTGRDNRNEPDLQPEDEREICRYTMEKFASELVFITHYPTKKRPFYTHPDPQDPEFTYSFDLLGRGLEWVTGSQRINQYQQLVDNIKKWGNDPKDFEIYLQAFKYGMPPEGGFCLGAERITMQVLGLDNIRQASLFPRDMERVDIKLASEKKKGKKK